MWVLWVLWVLWGAVGAVGAMGAMGPSRCSSTSTARMWWTAYGTAPGSGCGTGRGSAASCWGTVSGGDGGGSAVSCWETVRMGGWGGLGWAAPAGRWVPAGGGRRRPLPTPKPSARLHAGARRRPEPTRRAGRRFPPPTAQPRGPAASTDSPRAPFWPAAVRSCGDSSRHAAPGRRSGAGHEQPPAAPPSRLAARGRAVRGPAARRHARNARSRGGAGPRFPLSAGAASAAPVTS